MDGSYTDQAQQHDRHGYEMAVARFVATDVPVALVYLHIY
jgi:hypothetical protein